MEVHHHPQLEHKAKPWKEYLLEGLMIFLAVFMGFIAENIREKISDHEREKQYMESLVKDLASDTVGLKAGFPLKDERLRSIDSVFLFFENHPGAKSISVDVYRQMRRAEWDRVYVRNTGTINQLRNAGGLRLIRKQNVRDSLAAYDWFWDRLIFYHDQYIVNQHSEEELMDKMLNAADLVHAYRFNQKSLFQPGLVSTVRIEPAYMNQYINLLNWQRVMTFQDEIRYKEQENRASRLCKLIRKEYDLE
jgi:hypothetical protein